MKYFLCLFLTCLLTHGEAQNALNMSVLAHWDDESLPTIYFQNFNMQYSGCWGMALNGREYAVIGGALHLLFFDVTDPVHPVLIGKQQGNTQTGWREMKSYKGRIYAVSEEANEGLMIFDMRQAPDTVIRTYASTEFFNEAHTITLDTVSGRIYINGGTDNTGIYVLDVRQNPDKPVLLGYYTPLPGGYVHDSYVRNDTIYASSGNEGYYVFDFKDPKNPQLVAQNGTGGYNHSSWVTLDGRYAYYTEEIPVGRPIQIVDLQKLNTEGEIEPVGSFLDNLTEPDSVPKAIPHNLYIRDNLLFVSQYEDGLLIYDIFNPLKPVLIGYYDTHPQNKKYNNYYGCWGNYPWLPSGTIITSDMQNGMHLLKYTGSLGSSDSENSFEVAISPNPANGFLDIVFPADDNWTVCLLDASGRELTSEKIENFHAVRIFISDLPAGVYVAEITRSDGKRIARKVAFQ